MLPMSRRYIFGKRNSKYIHTTVPRSATSIGLEYLLRHNVPICTSMYKQRVQTILYQMFIGSAIHLITALQILITHVLN